MERLFYSRKENTLFWIIQTNVHNHVKQFKTLCKDLKIPKNEIHKEKIKESRRYNDMYVLYIKNVTTEPDNIVCIEKSMYAWIENE